MGGTVAVTLRKPDGTEYRMDRWTNSMPWGIMNMKTLNHDMAHVDKYLDQWIGMQNDYEKNKDSGEFAFDMTDCYFPSAGLAPCGYGLVVVDMVNNVILSMQGYTSFDNINAASVGLELPREMPEDNMVNFDPDGDAIRFKEFLDAGRVKGVTTKASFNEGREYDELDKTFSQVILKLMDWENGREWYQFMLDLGDWKYEVFEECDAKELVRYRDRLLELGFKLSKEEEEIWASEIKEAIEEYGDEI